MPPPPPHPSGTVVVLRDAPSPRRGPPSLASGSLRVDPRSTCLELLLLQRSTRDGQPGLWVFPGGKVDADDQRSNAEPADDARRAAVRETAEEAGLALDADALTLISRWVTPEIAPKRFDTWFFAAIAPADAAVRVDGAEISGHRWLAPGDALRAHHDHALRLAPPTFVTVTWLAEFATAADALRELPARRPAPFRPRIHRIEAGALMLYPGDAGYESGELEAAGARHRLWALADPWRYERTASQAPRSGARSEPKASEVEKVASASTTTPAPPLGSRS